jgi:hypothetical protein
MPPIYELYIQDRRYSVPTFVVVDASTDGRARARATEILMESANHMSVEVVRHGEPVAVVDRGRTRSDHQDAAPSGDSPAAARSTE